ncbi:MAG: type III pantothenate kinase [Verrucomicrobiota bacterium]
MILLLDIGNTHTHLGLADEQRVCHHVNLPTADWFAHPFPKKIDAFIKKKKINGAILCSVVPKATATALSFCQARLKIPCFELTAKNVLGIGIDYPKPDTIGPDRLANAVAVKHHFGAPSIVVDFGTAVTFDVVDARGNYVGGIIAPGLAAMTSYLHEKTALLPKIKIQETSAIIGKNTAEAMLIGAVRGYRGLIRELLTELQRELKCQRLPVVATGGCAGLIAGKLKEITKVDPLLTLEGLRLVWNHSRKK